MNNVRKFRELKVPYEIKQTFYNIRYRCYSPNDRHYKWYGGRGITVCNRWLEGGPRIFYKDMGDRPPGFVIDRIDNDKGYSPENCRWVSIADSLKNRRRAGMRKTLSKERVEEIMSFSADNSLSVGGLAKEYGVKKDVVYNLLAGNSFKRPRKLTNSGKKRPLTWEQAQEIRRRWSRRMGIEQIAKKMKCTTAMLILIKKGRYWEGRRNNRHRACA